MRLLLDTHVFLWRLLNDPRLSATADAMIDDLANSLYLSSASSFEIAAKVAAGKLRLPINMAAFVEAGMVNNQIAQLPISFTHTYGVASLPSLHRDPFDRLLIAVAIADGLTLLTNDAQIGRYPVPTAW